MNLHTTYNNFKDKKLNITFNVGYYYIDDEHDYAMQRCQHYVQNEFARIKIRISSSYLKRVQSLKYSDADKFSIVGGTLGLFTGFSFIVIFELFFWIGITLKKVFVKPREAKQEKKLAPQVISKKEVPAKKLEKSNVVKE